jgi:predicted PurR-regulated permease PerM
VAVIGLFVLAVFYTLYFTRSLLLPITLAVLLKLLFAPVVRGLKRLRVPEPVSAALVLLALLGALGLGVSFLVDPAAEWMAKAPETLRRIESRLRPLRAPVERIGEATQQVERMAGVGGDGDQAAVDVRDWSLGRTLLGGTWELLAATLVTLTLLYFLLASGDFFLRKLMHALSSRRGRRRAAEIAAEVEREVSAYLLTVTVVNLLFGAAVALAMWLLGMPNPPLWGVLAAATNYVPYLGALVCGGVLTTVAVLAFPDLQRAALVPLVFFGLNLVEAYFLTPALVGRRLTLHPVAVFLAVLFWGWIWGIPGGLLAVPILAATKIVCSRFDALRPLAEFLGGDPPEAPDSPATASSVPAAPA